MVEREITKVFFFWGCMCESLTLKSSWRLVFVFPPLALPNCTLTRAKKVPTLHLKKAKLYVRWKSKKRGNIPPKTFAKQWMRKKSDTLWGFFKPLVSSCTLHKKSYFSSLYIYNTVMTPKTLKTSSNQLRDGAGTVTPGPHEGEESWRKTPCFVYQSLNWLMRSLLLFSVPLYVPLLWTYAPSKL